MPQITEEQYRKFRDDMLKELNEMLRSTGSHKQYDKLTCDDCPHRHTCEWAGDSYNTDGDCLAEK